MYTIVGGGVSGLYLCFRLIESGIKRSDITLIERTNRLGGCILTYCSKQMGRYEAGAGRLNCGHELIQAFIRKMGIKKHGIYNEHYYIHDGNLDIIQPEKTKQIIDMLIIKSKQRGEQKKTKSLSLLGYATEFYPLSEINKVMFDFGYTTDFNYLNAYDSLRSLNEDLRGNKEAKMVQENVRIKSGFCTLDNGMYSIIDCLKQKVKGIHIIYNCEILDIKPYGKNEEKYKLVTNISGKNIYATKLILALPRHSLRKFKFLKEDYKISELLKSVAKEPIMRIYAKIPKFFEVIQSNQIPNKKIEIKRGEYEMVPKTNMKFTSNGLLRYIIPIAHDIVLIGYMDGKYASIWNDIDNMENKGYLKDRISQELQRMFPKSKYRIEFNRNSIKSIKCHYWKDCVHYWKPGKCSDTVSKQIINPKHNLYICSETYSQKQAWIEGALQQVERVLQKLI